MSFISPTDFSTNGKNAAKYAAILAQETSSSNIVSVAIINKAHFIVMGTKGAGIIKKFPGKYYRKCIEDSPAGFCNREQSVLYALKEIVFTS